MPLYGKLKPSVPESSGTTYARLLAAVVIASSRIEGDDVSRDSLFGCADTCHDLSGKVLMKALCREYKAFVRDLCQHHWVGEMGPPAVTAIRRI